MFWTSFICGLGATLGVFSVVTTFFIFMEFVDWLKGTKAAKAVTDTVDPVLESLNNRNDLTKQQIEQLVSIAHSMAIIADPGGDEDTK